MINKAMKDQQSRDVNIHKLTSLSGDNSLLSIRIQTAVHNPDLKPPALEHYNDVDGDPWLHLQSFKFKLILVKNAHRDKTKYLREYYYVNQLNFLEGLKVISYEDEPLCFTEKDLIGVFCPHNDALVITAWVAMWRVQRIMVDAGSSASVLFSNCYSQMQLAGDLIIPEDNPVVGFDGTAAKAVGRISLTINVGHKLASMC
ncbi:hypothetical protein FRX31_012891 [Thalictrum thalictroides]|uniref:Uncharacterized protein n=1 Tax=Thalictrum thalictroides TaxID=46969 RepID=A0A7J6WN58_THATH|nr:hypothetical protein FRX31_012891 [Thalictrum thalictroides]